MYYRKKPIVIEAIQWNGSNFHEIADFSGLNKLEIGVYAKSIYIETPEGLMMADIDYYIIKGIKGEIYPCKPDIFHASYELLGIDNE